MKKINRSFFLVMTIILVSVALVLSGCGSTATTTAGSTATTGTTQQGATTTTTAKAGPASIKIGFVTNLTVGGATEQGVATRNGFELAVKEINAAGGINGKTKIDVVYYDDEAKPEKAVEHVTRLINQDKVAAIVGYVNSGNALATIQLAQESEVPMLVNFATSTAITTTYEKEDKNYIFRYSMLDSLQVTKMLEYIQAKNFQKIGILHDTSGYGVNGMKDVVDQMTKKGMKATQIETLNTNDTDMTVQLQKFKAAGCDCILLYNLSPENANTIRSSFKVDYHPTFIGSWSIAYNQFARLLDKDMKNGVLMVTSYVVGQTPKSVELNKAMLAAYGSDVLPIGSAYGYDSAYLIAEAIKASDFTPQGIRDALENLPKFEGAVGPIEKPFSKTDHEAIPIDGYFVGVWKDDAIIKAP